MPVQSTKPVMSTHRTGGFLKPEGSPEVSTQILSVVARQKRPLIGGELCRELGVCRRRLRMTASLQYDVHRLAEPAAADGCANDNVP